MTVYSDATLRALTLNTHVGWSIRNGTLGNLVDRLDPDVLYLQEIKRRHKRLLREELGPGWAITGPEDSVLALRLPRFVVLDTKAPEITFGEQYDRYATGAVAVDTVTGRRLAAQSVHVQPLGRGLSGATEGARRRQTRQLRALARWQKRRNRRVVSLDGGDFNQNLRDRPEDLRPEIRPHSAYSLYEIAGMVGAHELKGDGKRPARLDGFMVRPAPFVRVRRHRVVQTHRKGDDHPAVFCVLHVKALK